MKAHRTWIGPIFRAVVAAGLAALSLSATAQNRLFECVAGNCSNGRGTARTWDGNEFTGPFVGGQFADAIYDVRYKGLPAQSFQLTYSAALQQPIEGTQIRGSVSDTTFGHSVYEGKFGSVFSPFANANLAAFSTGRYTSGTGIVYEGEFEYIPVRLYTSNAVFGVYIFLGARIDKETDEVRQGLFISEPFGAGMNITLRRARPDYIETLRSEYQMQTNAAASDRTSAENSRAAFGLFMDVLGGMASMKALNNGALSGSMGNSTRSTLGLLRGAMTGQSGTETALNGVLGQLQGRLGASGLATVASGNPLQDKLIQNAAQGDIKAVLRDLAKQGMKQSFKEYEESLKPR